MISNAEKVAGGKLIDTIRAARSGLEMAAGVNRDRMTEDDLTFVMEQAMLAVGKLSSALAHCREANRAIVDAFNRTLTLPQDEAQTEAHASEAHLYVVVIK